MQILFYMISNALPEVWARGKEETISPSRLLRNLSDSRSSPIINTLEGGKVVEGELRLIIRMLTSAMFRLTAKESEDKQAQTVQRSLISKGLSKILHSVQQMSLKE